MSAPIAYVRKNRINDYGRRTIILEIGNDRYYYSIDDFPWVSMFKENKQISMHNANKIIRHGRLIMKEIVE